MGGHKGRVGLVQISLALCGCRQGTNCVRLELESRSRAMLCRSLFRAAVEPVWFGRLARRCAPKPQKNGGCARSPNLWWTGGVVVAHCGAHLVSAVSPGQHVQLLCCLLPEVYK